MRWRMPARPKSTEGKKIIFILLEKYFWTGLLKEKEVVPKEEERDQDQTITLPEEEPKESPLQDQDSLLM